MNRNLVALSRVAKPHISVVDGFVAMHREGPRHGTPIKLGTVVAGTDAVAVDAVAAAVMGFDPMRVGYLEYAHEAGLGIADLDAIAIVGDPIASVARRCVPHSNDVDPAPLGPPARDRPGPGASRPCPRLTPGPPARRRPDDEPSPAKSSAIIVALTDPAPHSPRASPGSPTRRASAARSCSLTPRGRSRRIGRPFATVRVLPRPVGRLAPDSGAMACWRPTPSSSRSRRPRWPRPRMAGGAEERLRETGAAGVGGPIGPGPGSRHRPGGGPAALRRVISHP